MNDESRLSAGLGALAQRVVAVCHQRGWSLRWDARLAQLACESAEFAEAARGKRGDLTAEAGDMLFVLMSWTESAGVPWADVVAACDSKCAELETRPRYAGEQHEAPNASFTGEPKRSVGESGASTS